MNKEDFERIAIEYSKKMVAQLFPENIERIRNGICVACRNEIEDFRNAINEKEYEISGLCLDCQNKVFKGEKS